jgi:hypothetical protein
MTGTVPIFKLHGSLNWTLGAKSIEVYQDFAAGLPLWRHGGDYSWQRVWDHLRHGDWQWYLLG